MRKVKEILRLSRREGASQREIAQSTGLVKTTIQEVLAKTSAAGLDWTGQRTMGEYDLLKKVVYPKLLNGAAARSLSDWPTGRIELLNKGNSLVPLRMDCKQAHPTGCDTAASAAFLDNVKGRAALQSGKTILLEISSLSTSPD
jgi:hypothetical protein